MLSRIIVSAYAVFIEIALWLSLSLSIIGGWHFGYQEAYLDYQGVIGALSGLVIWFVMAVIFFGAFLVLEDIRRSVKKIEEAKSNWTEQQK